MDAKPLILASGSSIRQTLLRNAGVEIAVHPARIDENAVRMSLLAENTSSRDLADALADLKAQKIGRRHAESLVLGCDQILDCDGVVFEKPETLDQAKAQLTKLSGKTHTLYAASVLYQGPQPVWRFIGQARLTMRELSDSFIDIYAKNHGSGLLDTVGSYKIEEGGAVLFDRIEGDYFSILGLPLLEVLAHLRTIGFMKE